MLTYDVTYRGSLGCAAVLKICTISELVQSETTNHRGSGNATAWHGHRYELLVVDTHNVTLEPHGLGEELF